MVADLDVPVRILPVETVREPDGLAMSSRNRYLSADERQAAAVLSRALREAAAAGGRRGAVGRPGSTDLGRDDRIGAAGAARLRRGRRRRDARAPGRARSRAEPAVALVAARVGPARLIDNAPLPTG